MLSFTGAGQGESAIARRDEHRRAATDIGEAGKLVYLWRDVLLRRISSGCCISVTPIFARRGMLGRGFGGADVRYLFE